MRSAGGFAEFPHEFGRHLIKGIWRKGQRNSLDNALGAYHEIHRGWLASDSDLSIAYLHFFVSLTTSDTETVLYISWGGSATDGNALKVKTPCMNWQYENGKCECEAHRVSFDG
jgi:hypothetical protein